MDSTEKTLEISPVTLKWSRLIIEGECYRDEQKLGNQTKDILSDRANLGYSWPKN